METFIFWLIAATCGACLWLWERRSEAISRLSAHVATSLDRAILEPIKNRVIEHDNGKSSMTMDDNVARYLIEYVGMAKHVLTSFYSKSWDYQSPKEKAAWHTIVSSAKVTRRELKRAWKVVDKAQARRERIPEYRLWQRMEDRFFGKEYSLTGQDLYDPFAYWAGTLYRIVKDDSIKLDEILELHICEHGDAAFRTARKMLREKA